MLLVQKIHEDAKLPTKGSAYAAGYDLSSVENVTINAGTRAVVKTGLRIAVQPDCYLRIAPRSGLAVKKGIDTLAGVVDADYRGEIMVVLINHGSESFEIKIGDRIAQAIPEKISCAPLLEVVDLDETTRGAGGFGSTGI